MVLQVLKPTPSEDKLDKLMKVMNIVNSVYGIKTNSANIDLARKKAETERIKAETAAKPKPGGATDAAKGRQMDFDLNRMKRLSSGGSLNEGDLFHFTEKHGGSFSPNRQKGSMGPFAGPGNTILYYSPTKETLLFSEKAVTQKSEQDVKAEEALKKRQEALKIREETKTIVPESEAGIGLKGAQQGKTERETGFIERKVESEARLKDAQAQKTLTQAGEIDYLKEARRQDLLAKAAANRAKAKAEKSGKNLKASQFVAANYSLRMEQADKDLREVMKGGFDPTSLGGSLSADWSPETLKGQGAKRFSQAKRNFINATLRRESGAAISPSEHTGANKQYFPVSGDGPKVLAQKARNRLTVMSAFRSEAGQAYNLTKIQMMETSKLRQKGQKGVGSKLKKMKTQDLEKRLKDLGGK